MTDDEKEFAALTQFLKQGNYVKYSNHLKTFPYIDFTDSVSLHFIMESTLF
jgi:hypothetical protein